MIKTTRRPAAAALLALLLTVAVLAAAPARAADRPGRALPAVPEGLLARAQHWLAAVLGWGGGAAGPHRASASGEVGVGIDPNGLATPGPASGPGGSVSGAIDPNGTSAADTDRGVGIDPDG